MKSAALAHKAGPAARASKPEPREREQSAGSPAFVQAMVQTKCAACESEPEAPVQMWSCTEYTKPTCTDQVQKQHDEPHEPVQMWSCTEYTKPTCTDQVQKKCDACEAENHDQVQHAATSKTRSPQVIHGAARSGLAGANQSLPHGERIQAAFGHHDISHVRTSTGGSAAGASKEMGALAYTSGDRIAFRDAPDLRLAAHEAAHVVQQRAGLKLPGGVGRAGDRWERHADSVADAVVAGRSAQGLLDEVAQPGGTSVTPPVQRHLTADSERILEP